MGKGLEGSPEGTWVVLREKSRLREELAGVFSILPSRGTGSDLCGDSDRNRGQGCIFARHYLMMQANMQDCLQSQTLPPALKQIWHLNLKMLQALSLY